MAENLLEVNHVVKNYSKHRALNDVSIQVANGSIFGLLGPNGAGKTSLIRIINQITAPDSGNVLFNGQPLQPHHISQIGYLPEERGLYKKMKVGEQALYLARLKGISTAQAKITLKYWFDKFEILPWWDKTIEELSKGMQQKVQFIVTVLHEPKLLILDEPFSGFDPINANLIKNEILELKQKGTTIIFSTHNMQSVEDLCDEIALINKSEVVLSGSVKNVKDSYKNNTYAITFKGNLIAFTNALWTSFELLSNTEKDGLYTANIKLLGNASVNDLLSTVIPHVQVVGLQEIIPSMNEIFIQCVTAKNIPSHE